MNHFKDYHVEESKREKESIVRVMGREKKKEIQGGGDK